MPPVPFQGLPGWLRWERRHSLGASAAEDPLSPEPTLPIAPIITRWIAVATGRRALIGVPAALAGSALAFRLGPYETVRAAAGLLGLPEEADTSPAAVSTFLTQIGEAGRAQYATFQYWDFLNPVLITIAGTLLLGWLLGRTGLGQTRWALLLLLPVLGGVADVAENLLLLQAVGHFPAPAPLGGALPIVTMIKFGGIVAVVPVALVLGVIAAARGRRAAR